MAVRMVPFGMLVASLMLLLAACGTDNVECTSNDECQGNLVCVRGGCVFLGDDEDVATDTTPEPDADTTPEPDADADVAPDVVPDTVPDVVPDIVPDVVPDVRPDVVPDVVPDVAPDVLPDIADPEEICGNGLDDDGDGDVDCGDADCRGTAACIERCDDGVDNDADGDVDCDDSDCADVPRCIGPPTSCDDVRCPTGNACWPGDFSCRPITPVNAHVPPADVAFVSRMLIADNQAPATTCCVDVDGDGTIDNGFGVNVLPLLFGLAGDIDEIVDDIVDQGDNALLIALEPTATGYAVSFYAGTNDLDGDGIPDQTTADRASGAGVFRAYEAGYDRVGARSLAPLRLRGGVVETDPIPGLVTLGLSISPTTPITVPIRDARLVGTASVASGRLISGTRTVDGEVVSSLGIGGYIELDDLFDGIDQLLRSCRCADGIDGSRVVFHGEGETRYGAACVERSYDVTGCSDSFCSEQLNLICGTVLPALGAIPLADLDMDGTGVAESMSFGQFLTTVPATWDTPWVEPGDVRPSVLLPQVADAGCSAASGARGGSMAALLGFALAITRRRQRD